MGYGLLQALQFNVTEKVGLGIIELTLISCFTLVSLVSTPTLTQKKFFALIPVTDASVHRKENLTFSLYRAINILLTFIVPREVKVLNSLDLIQSFVLYSLLF